MSEPALTIEKLAMICDYTSWKNLADLIGCLVSESRKNSPAVFCIKKALAVHIFNLQHDGRAGHKKAAWYLETAIQGLDHALLNDQDIAHSVMVSMARQATNAIQEDNAIVETL